MRGVFRITFIAIMVLVVASVANAQATRTWVSGVGDDANPCSRTAPCKTFAGAISKTATGGEINVLDPGGFGGVTITKSITIDGAGFMAGVLVAGTNGIIVNAGTGTVSLRGLQVDGVGTGLSAIKVLAAGTVRIEGCNIFNWRGSPGRGVDITPAAATTTNVFIDNTTITDNLAAAVAVVPTGGTPTTNVTITNSRFNRNASGVFAGTGAIYTINDTAMTENTVTGIDAALTGVVNCVNCQLASNARGIQAAGNSIVRIGQCSIFNNPTAGFTITGSAVITTFSDNYIAGNGANSGALSPLGPS